jgi:hypothetical protein
MLASALVTALLTAALGTVSSFHWAVAIRALMGFCDGVMTLSKGSMAKISDKTNSARAFSTFGVAYGLGTTVAPTLSAVLAYPCGGDPNADSSGDGGGAVFASCPAEYLREYPFFLSSVWVALAGMLLWLFAFQFLNIDVPSRDGAATRDVRAAPTSGVEGWTGGSKAAWELGRISLDDSGYRQSKAVHSGRTIGGDVHALEMATLRDGDADKGGNGGEDGEDLLPACAAGEEDGGDGGGGAQSSSNATFVSMVAVSGGGTLEEGEGYTRGYSAGEESKENCKDDDGGEVLLRMERKGGGRSDGDGGDGDDAQTVDEEKGVGSGAGSVHAAVPWHKDPTVRLAIINQVGCTYIVLTGAELTPIWMATTRANGRGGHRPAIQSETRLRPPKLSNYSPTQNPYTPHPKLRNPTPYTLHPTP